VRRAVHRAPAQPSGSCVQALRQHLFECLMRNWTKAKNPT
jgi:hypothetical protein